MDVDRGEVKVTYGGFPGNFRQIFNFIPNSSMWFIKLNQLKLQSKLCKWHVNNNNWFY